MVPFLREGDVECLLTMEVADCRLATAFLRL